MRKEKLPFLLFLVDLQDQFSLKAVQIKLLCVSHIICFGRRNSVNVLGHLRGHFSCLMLLINYDSDTCILA